MTRHFSAGGIVFNGQGQVLLIKTAALRDPTKSYWGFPKGHLEEGESSKQAALREVEEETGIQAEVLDKVGESKYMFTVEGEKQFKVVVFFAMKYLGGQINVQAQEVAEARWFEYEPALKLINFKNDKEFLTKAWEMLNG